jgi:hypothetical protein
VFKKFEKNIYCSPYTLQIINVGSLQFPKLKGKINFGSKLYFSYFLVIDVRNVRESHRNPEKIYVGTDFRLGLFYLDIAKKKQI